MPSRLAWLFNNKRDSDIAVVLSTEPAATACTQRRQDAPDGAASADAPVPSSSEEPITTRTLYGHMVVLNSYSEYFQAWSSKPWQSNGARGSQSSGSNRGHSELEEDVPKAYIHVATSDLVPVAEAMVKFMYTEEVEKSDVATLLQLLVLADGYGVVQLIEHVGRQLQQTQFDTWTTDEMLMSTELPQCVQANGAVGGFTEAFKEHLWLRFPETKAATDKQDSGNRMAIIEWFLSQHLDLNEALSNDVQFQAFQTWPAAAVVSLLSRDDLQVPSENIVMVVIRSWLESNTSVSGSEREQVLQQLRLPQLRPCIIALLIKEYSVQGPDRHWLPADAIEKLGYYLGAGRTARERLQALPLCKNWGRKRLGCAAEGTFKYSFPLSEVEENVQELMDDPDTSTLRFGMGENHFVDGFFCYPDIRLQRVNDGAIVLRVVMNAEMAFDDMPGFLAGYFDDVSLDVSHPPSGATWSWASEWDVNNALNGNVAWATAELTRFSVLSASTLHSDVNRALADWLQEDGTVGPFKLVYRVLPERQ